MDKESEERKTLGEKIKEKQDYLKQIHLSRIKLKLKKKRIGRMAEVDEEFRENLISNPVSDVSAYGTN